MLRMPNLSYCNPISSIPIYDSFQRPSPDLFKNLQSQQPLCAVCHGHHQTFKPSWYSAHCTVIPLGKPWWHMTACRCVRKTHHEHLIHFWRTGGSVKPVPWVHDVHYHIGWFQIGFQILVVFKGSDTKCLISQTSVWPSNRQLKRQKSVLKSFWFVLTCPEKFAVTLSTSHRHPKCPVVCNEM